MSAHSFIQIGQHLLLASRESYVPSLAALFREDELHDDRDSYGYTTTVAVMRDRLQLQGFTSERAQAELKEAVGVWQRRHPNPDADAIGIPVQDAGSLQRDLELFLNSTDQWAHYDEPQEVFYQLDERTVLRLALDVVADGSRALRHNLDDLASWGMIARGTPIADQAREDQRNAVARNALLVVLTEGSSDSRLLADAVSVTHPHLSGFLRFMDFSAGAEGSAASLARLIRSFIGAGIGHRVLGLADNDTAAYDALHTLKREGLPDGYRLLHYPDIPLLESYPTLGPQLREPVPMNINGKAGSLEMYLGKDLLTLDGELIPVQWTGYIEGQRSYQGAIAKHHKSRLHSAFEEKVATARRDAAARSAQDWSGVDAIVQAIMRAFD